MRDTTAREMKVRIHAKQRSTLCWQRFLRLHTPDDTSTGLWAAKRAYQAHSLELVRTGQRPPEWLIFIPTDVVKAAIIRRRTDEF